MVNHCREKQRKTGIQEFFANRGERGRNAAYSVPSPLLVREIIHWERREEQDVGARRKEHWHAFLHSNLMSWRTGTPDLCHTPVLCLDTEGTCQGCPQLSWDLKGVQSITSASGDS